MIRCTTGSSSQLFRGSYEGSINAHKLNSCRQRMHFEVHGTSRPGRGENRKLGHRRKRLTEFIKNRKDALHMSYYALQRR